MFITMWHLPKSVPYINLLTYLLTWLFLQEATLCIAVGLSVCLCLSLNLRMKTSRKLKINLKVTHLLVTCRLVFTSVVKRSNVKVMWLHAQRRNEPLTTQEWPSCHLHSWNVRGQHHKSSSMCYYWAHNSKKQYHRKFFLEISLWDKLSAVPSSGEKVRVLKGHSGAELHIYFLVHLESIYYQIFFYSKIVPNCTVAK